jgi:hypothetical protein
LSKPPGVQYDDIYVTDTATRLGERKIETLRGNSDQLVTWVRNTGSTNSGAVSDSTVDGDTSYVETASIGARDLYGSAGLTTNPSNIDCVNVVQFSYKTDATTRAVYGSIQSNGVDSDGSLFPMSGSYQRYDRIVQTDPSGGGAWTTARVNGLLFGPKLAA